MIDNKKLTQNQMEGLRTITYQLQVEVFEKNCSQCPFRIVQIGTEVSYQDYGKRNFSKNTTYVDYSDIPYSEAILILQELFTNTEMSVVFKRGCNFGDNELTLTEIIMNTCRFWKTETCEGGDNPDQQDNSFIEVDEGAFIGSIREAHSSETLPQ